MKLVLNATPLIYLVKCGVYRFLDGIDLELITTSYVEAEILSPNFPEYAELKSFLVKHVKVVDAEISPGFSSIQGLDKGEASVLSISKKLSIPAVIDDKLARICANGFGISCYYTTFFLFRAFDFKKINKSEAIRFLDKMINDGWHCDIATYVRIRNKIEAL